MTTDRYRQVHCRDCNAMIGVELKSAHPNRTVAFCFECADPQRFLLPADDDAAVDDDDRDQRRDDEVQHGAFPF